MTFDTHSQLTPNIPSYSWCKYFPSLFRATWLALLDFLVVLWHFRDHRQEAVTTCLREPS